MYTRVPIHQGNVVEISNGKGFFCDWAWNDIHKLLFAMQLGGDFSPWMKDKNTFIACCTDGVKPVVFKLERLEE